MYSMIVVDYNTIENTIAYIKRVQEALVTDNKVHYIIVDNGNRTDTVKKLESNFGRGSEENFVETGKNIIRFSSKDATVVYYKANENLGYARGNNIGAKIAEKLFLDVYYIISNNDLIFPEEVQLSHIEKIFKADKKIGIVGPRIVSPRYEIQSPHAKKSAFNKLILWWWIMAIGGHFSFLIDDICYSQKSSECDWVTGCFFFIKAEAFRQVGMFDESTFLYAEEIILSDRMRANGFRTYFLNELEIVHNHSATIKKHVSALKNAQITFESNYYYYSNYCKTPLGILKFAKINFALYKLMFGLRHRG